MSVDDFLLEGENYLLWFDFGIHYGINKAKGLRVVA